MSTVGVKDLRNRTADVVARAHAGEDIIITIHGIPSARLVPIRAKRRPYLTKADLLEFPQADPGLKDDREQLAGDSTDDLDEIL